MRQLALLFLIAGTVAGCARGEDSDAAATDTVAMPPVDGSVPLVSPGGATAPAAAGDAAAGGAGQKSGGASRDAVPATSRDSARPGTTPERDSAIMGPFYPVPVPPDTGRGRS